MISTDKIGPRFSRLSKGINIGEWFHNQPDLASVNVNRISDGELRFLRVLGVQHIRLPISMKFFTNVASPGAPDAAAMSKLDTVISRLIAQDLAVIVTLFDENSLTWYGSTSTTRDAHCVKLCAFWKALAAHLSRHRADRVFLEALNEPRAATAAIWYAQQAKIIASMRQGAPDHTIIASANMNVNSSNYDTMAALEAMVPLADANVVYNFHCYKPHAFSHQAAIWEGSLPELATLNKMPYPATALQLESALATYPDAIKAYVRKCYSYGSPIAGTVANWNTTHIGTIMQRAKNWALKYSTTTRKIYVTCNEFGVYRGREENGVKRGVDPAARNRWLYDMRTNMEVRGVGWAMWENEGGFGLGSRGPDRVWRNDPATAQAIGLGTLVTPPSTVTFSTPLNNATVANLNQVKGTALNAAYGIKQVELTIYNVALKKWWTYANGAFFWSTAAQARPADYAAGVWSRLSDGVNMPAGTNLPDGSYILTARAYDGQNSRTDAKITIQVLKPLLSSTKTISLAASGAPLLSTLAGADGDDVQLTFQNTLDIYTATDFNRYRVEVNGRLADVQSLAYDPRRGRVTLSLAPGTLRPGDQISIDWSDLRDNRGAPLSGHADFVVAT